MSVVAHYTDKEANESARAGTSILSKCCLLLPSRRFVIAIAVYFVVLVVFLIAICRGNDAEPAVVFAIFTTFYCLLLCAVGYFFYSENVQELRSMESKEMKLLAVQIVVVPLVLYFIGVLIAYLVQPMFLYPGAVFELDSESEPRGLSIAFPDKVFSVVSSDGSTILGWRDTFGSGSGAAIPLLFIGGIGGSMWSNVGFATVVIGAETSAGRRFEVFSYSYRGYEPNDQLSPSEGALIQDAIAVFAFITDLYNGTSPIVLSHSLGTGSAVAVAEHFSQRTVILHGKRVIPPCIGLFTPFAGVHRVALDLAFYTPFPFVWGLDSWRSYERATRIDRSMPMIVFSAGQDATILAYQHRALFNVASNVNKSLVVDPDADHNDLRELAEIQPTVYADWFSACYANM